MFLLSQKEKMFIFGEIMSLFRVHKGAEQIGDLSEKFYLLIV